MSYQTVRQRINERGFPSAFQAWNPAQNVAGESATDTLARHDLVFHGPEFFELRWMDGTPGLPIEFTPASIDAARQLRTQLLRRNPNLTLLAEIRYRDAGSGCLPDDHPFWRRDARGKRVPGWVEGGYFLLNYDNPQFRAQVAAQAAACVKSGVLDGVLVDWWGDEDDGRLMLARAVRNAIGPESLILVNGLFMECYRAETPDDWRQIAETLIWAEANLRAPQINCVETWYQKSRQSPAGRARMRATTALTLVHSNGCCLFSDPNPLPTPDHRTTGTRSGTNRWVVRLGEPSCAATARRPAPTSAASSSTIRREIARFL